MSPVEKALRSICGTASLCVLALVFCTQSGVADPTFAPGVSQGTVTSGSIEEASGIASSRNNDGVLWVHNDSGDVARLFAINTQGQLLGTYNIMQPGTTNFATATDFEDIAMGPGPQAGLSYIYVGDIGDNGSSRASISVYRIAEPVVYGRQAASPVTVNLNQEEWESITLTYPLFFWLFYTHDAEVLMCDPQTGDLYVATKTDTVMRIFRAAAADLVGGATVAMTQIGGDYSFRRATAGCFSPTGSEIVVRGYSNNPDYGYPAAKLWTRSAGQTVAQALAGTPVTIPIASEPQGEAIDFDGIGSGYFTLSENSNQPLYYYERTSAGPTAPTSLVAAGADWRYLDNGSDQGTAWRQQGFDDSGWAVGTGQLGYGDGDEQTVVSYGPDVNNKYVTTYFRKTFQVDPSLAFDTLTLKLLYDDGAAVYLNGTEIARRNLASGAGFDALATGTQQALENTWLVLTVNPALLVSGTNTVAVEVHQVSRSDTDVSFDLQLSGTAHQQWFALAVTRNNDSWGTVDVQPNQPLYLGGSVVALTAAPADGFLFSSWSGDASGSSNPTTVTMDGNKSVTANFVDGQTLTLNVVNGDWGTVTAEPNLPLYATGAAVTLTATPIEGKSFREWTIWSDPNLYPDANYALIDNNPVLHLTMDHDYTVEAAFKCGSGLPPFIAMALLVLTGTVLIRRMT